MSGLPEKQDKQGPNIARPWPRFWARMGDVSFESAIVGILVLALEPGIIGAPIFTQPGGTYLLGFFVLPLSMILDAAITAAFGTTIFKAIGGLQIQSVSGERPRFGLLLQRNFWIWLTGLAAGIPVATVITMALCKARLSRNEVLDWDRKTKTRCYAVVDSTFRTAIAACLVLTIAIGAALYERSPVDPDAFATLTVESFNARAPRMLTTEVRLDGARIGQDRTLTIRYTIVHWSPVGASDAIPFFEDTALEVAACADVRLKQLRSAGMRVVHEYVDPQGQVINWTPIDDTNCQVWGAHDKTE